MTVGIIDLGTNTFNLVIAKLDKKGITQILHSSKLSVRLGQGCFVNKRLTEEAIDRGMNALNEHLQVCYNHKAAPIAFATSAVRNATNKEIFLNKVKVKFNLDIQVIDGNREAELIYEGVKLGLDMNDTISLIVDIGGGSTEFIISDKNKIYWKRSFEIGAARMLEKFNPSNPITENEIIEIEKYLNKELKPLFKVLKDYPIETLIGSSGSFDTFAEMIAHKFYNPDIIEGKTEYNFDLFDYYDIHEQLIKSTHIERLNTKGLIEMRADMIVVATVLVNFLLNKSGIKKMRLSTYSLKEGVLAEIIKDKFQLTAQVL